MTDTLISDRLNRLQRMQERLCCESLQEMELVVGILSPEIARTVHPPTGVTPRTIIAALVINADKLVKLREILGVK